MKPPGCTNRHREPWWTPRVKAKGPTLQQASHSRPHSAVGLTLSRPHSVSLTLYASRRLPSHPSRPVASLPPQSENQFVPCSCLTLYASRRLPSHPSRPVAPLPPQSENQFVPCSWYQFALWRRGSGRSGAAQRRGHCGFRRSEPAQRRGSRRSGSAQRGGSRFSDVRPCPMVP
ncbi:unnamed protein product [Gadus morhua 'NCC']